MENRTPDQLCARPWADWFARRIDDPVTRLKFLRSVNPLATPPQKTRRRWPRIAVLISIPVLAVATLLWFGFSSLGSESVKTVKAATPKLRVPEPTVAVAAVWLVEQSGHSEVYSNGLRIDATFESPNHRRSYLSFSSEEPDAPGTPGDRPVGIVFHTTESLQAPFQESANGALKRIGESLVDFVRRKHAYHYLIDRFGRVYRIVPESDAANHAGFSVWADDRHTWLNLNESFLGVSFEAQTEPGQMVATVSPAQVRSAAMLTEMLRDRYKIAPGNCVTHAQVSVNPGNMRVGYHTDWASAFPFARMGLPDNYALPLQALTAFGFEYDETFVQWAGTRLYAGVESAAQNLARQAAAAAVSPVALRKTLRNRYRRRLAEVRGRAAVEEQSDQDRSPE